MDEVGHSLDAIDVARVVAEVDTTESGKGTHEVGLPGDGSLDAVDIIGGRHLGEGSTGHDVGDCWQWTERSSGSQRVVD